MTNYAIGKEELTSKLSCLFFRERGSIFVSCFSGPVIDGPDLRWLVDIHQIVKQKLDWQKLFKLLKHQYPRVGGPAPGLASQLLKTPFVEEMKPLLSGDTSRRIAQEAICC